jgi:hypothetical protein
MTENAHSRTVLCPQCGKANQHVHENGHVEGPREYHAECWMIAEEKMTEEEIEEAWNNSKLPR